MKTAVLKLSGKTLEDFITSNKWIETIKYLYSLYDSLIIVHGAGTEISAWSTKLGIQSEFINGQRVTSKEMMDVVAAVQAGLLNARITAKLNSNSIESSGFTGIDRNTFTAAYVDKNMGFVGVPELTGSAGWIFELLSSKIIPVFSSVCKDKDGNLMNINADIFTGALAVTVNAETVYFVSDVEGVKLNGGFVNTLTQEEILIGIAEKEIYGGMIPKLLSCIELINKGVEKVWIGSDINKDTNSGTWITGSPERRYNIGIA